MWGFRLFGDSRAAKVTSEGELVVAPISYDQTSFNELGVDDQVYNFYEPIPKRRFVITGVFAYGDKQVPTGTNATVEIYEATSTSDAVVAKAIMTFEIGQNQFQPYSPINIVVTEGRYINARTDDDDVHLNIFGHFINCTDCA